MARKSFKRQPHPTLTELERLRAAAARLESGLAFVSYGLAEIVGQTAVLRAQMQQGRRDVEAAALRVAEVVSRRLETADRRADLALAPPGIVDALGDLRDHWWLELKPAAEELGRVLGRVWEPEAFRKAFARHGRPEWKRRGLLAMQYDVAAITLAIRRGEF